MRRRKLLVALAGLAVVVAAGAMVLWPQPPSRITRENCDRIREGMSRVEVLAILGPPGDYRTIQTVDPVPLYYRSDTPTPADYAKAAYDWENIFVIDEGDTEKLKWLGDEGNIHVRFGPNGVSFHCLLGSNKVTQTPLDNLLWRAKRQWRRWFPE